MASATLAITIDPDNWPAVLASLRKWRPEFFSERKKRSADNRPLQSVTQVSRGNPPHTASRRFLAAKRSVEKCTI